MSKCIPYVIPSSLSLSLRCRCNCPWMQSFVHESFFYTFLSHAHFTWIKCFLKMYPAATRAGGRRGRKNCSLDHACCTFFSSSSSFSLSLNHGQWINRLPLHSWPSSRLQSSPIVNLKAIITEATKLIVEPEQENNRNIDLWGSIFSFIKLRCEQRNLCMCK